MSTIARLSRDENTLNGGPGKGQLDGGDGTGDKCYGGTGNDGDPLVADATESVSPGWANCEISGQ